MDESHASTSSSNDELVPDSSNGVIKSMRPSKSENSARHLNSKSKKRNAAEGDTVPPVKYFISPAAKKEYAYKDKHQLASSLHSLTTQAKSAISKGQMFVREIQSVLTDLSVIVGAAEAQIQLLKCVPTCQYFYHSFFPPTSIQIYVSMLQKWRLKSRKSKTECCRNFVRPQQTIECAWIFSEFFSNLLWYIAARPET